MAARTWAAVLGLVAGIGPAVGCVTVRPSQRQVLSSPEMDPNADTMEESFYSHVEAAREGAVGGHGAAGGGCGCG